MDQITIETLTTTAGIVGVVMVVIQVLKVLVPMDFTASVLRRIALVTGTGLFIVVALTSGPGEGTNTALFWVIVAINGLITGLAATGLFETVKYGTDRVIESSE